MPRTKRRETPPIVVDAPPQWLSDAADRLERRFRGLAARRSKESSRPRPPRVASPLRVALISALFLALLWLVFVGFWDRL